LVRNLLKEYFSVIDGKITSVANLKSAGPAAKMNLRRAKTPRLEIIMAADS
jgi:hypothetical protein